MDNNLTYIITISQLYIYFLLLKYYEIDINNE